MNSKIGGISLIWLSSISVSVASLIFQVILTNYLSVNDYGRIASGLSAITIISALATLGLNDYLIREYSKCNSISQNNLNGIYALTYITFIAISVILAILYYIIDAELIHDIILLSPLVLMNSLFLLNNSKYVVLGSHKKIATLQLINPSLKLLVVLGLFLFSQHDLMTTLSALLLIGMIGIVVQKIIGNKISSLELTQNPELTLTYLSMSKKSFPFTIATFCHLIYFQSDVIIIREVMGAYFSGIYNVAFLIITFSYTIPAVVYQKVLLPKIYSWVSQGNLAEIRKYNKTLIWNVVFGATTALLVYFLCEPAIVVFFGVDYIESVNIVRLLVIAIPLRFLSTAIGPFLLIEDMISKKILAMSSVAVFNVVLNINFIPVYGMYGAAVTTILSELILLLMYFYLSKKVSNES